MTTEELRSRQLELFTAMIDGKQIQRRVDNGIFLEDLWKSIDVCDASTFLFNERDIKHIRIKPEPRKVWVGWRGPEFVTVFAEDEESFQYLSNKYPAYKWKIVEEPA